MGFPIDDLFSIRSFLLAGARTFQLFKNDISATCTCKTISTKTVRKGRTEHSVLNRFSLFAFRSNHLIEKSNC